MPSCRWGGAAGGLALPCHSGLLLVKAANAEVSASMFTNMHPPIHMPPAHLPVHPSSLSRRRCGRQRRQPVLALRRQLRRSGWRPPLQAPRERWPRLRSSCRSASGARAGRVGTLC